MSIQKYNVGGILMREDSGSLSITYRMKDDNIAGVLVLSADDTGSREGIMTAHLWEAYTIPRE